MYRLLPFLFLWFGITANAIGKVDYKVEGLESHLEDNVLAYIQGTPEPKGKHLAPFRKTLLKESNKALNALGYYHPQIKLKINRDKTDLVVKLTIDPGPVTRLTKVDIRLLGEGETDPRFKQLVADLGLKEGQALDHGLYESSKNSFSSLALQRGYFDAKFNKSTVEVTAEENSGRVFLWFDTGPRYKFGEVHLLQETPAQDLVLSMVPFKPGESYNAHMIAKYSLSLSDTNYFQQVLVRPNLANAKHLAVPVEVAVDLKPSNSFEIGGGYSTDVGPRGKLNWKKPWVNKWGHSIGAELELSKLKQVVSANYKIPMEDPNNNYINIQTGYQKRNENNINSDTYTLGVQRYWKTPDEWDRIAFVRYQWEDSDLVANPTQNLIPGISYARTRTRGGLNAFWGDRQLLSLEMSNQAWLSDSNFIKAHGQTKWLRTFNEKHKFLARLELGAILTKQLETDREQKNEDNKVPATVRFFTGGDTSVRGFGYKTISPKDDDGNLVGAKYLTVTSLEYSYPIKDKWSVATFVDAGTATNDFSEQIKVGAGVGVAWSSPVGPIRVYLATPVNSEDKGIKGIEGIHLHFLMGPVL